MFSEKNQQTSIVQSALLSVMILPAFLAGRFTMGSLKSDEPRAMNQAPLHCVTPHCAAHMREFGHHRLESIVSNVNALARGERPPCLVPTA